MHTESKDEMIWRKILTMSPFRVLQRRQHDAAAVTAA
jgi:hypothetical protein